MTDERKARFTAVVSRRQQGLYRLALMMLRNAPDAEDAVAQGMENCWRKMGRILQEDALSAYLTRCVMNTCRDMLRKRKRETVTDNLEIFMQPPKTETPVWMYLSALDDTYRIPLMLRYSENLPNTEIAKILHLPAGTVSSRIARGLNILRNQMEKEEKGHD
ncbi:MAG: RNA polymerase sigma factor [Clostridia bacterium]|nr:RNA polymerase sigma factor [Clostridia bacterium]